MLNTHKGSSSRNMSDEDYERYLRFFKKADNDGDNKLTFNELRATIRQGGYPIRTPELKRIFRNVDESGDDCISLQEYMKEMGQRTGNDHIEAPSPFEKLDEEPDGWPTHEMPKSVPIQLGYDGSDSENKEDDLRQALFDYTQRNEIDQVKRVLQDMKNHNWQPGRDEKYRTTVLHFALYHSADDVARYFIEHPCYEDVNLLKETCNLCCIPKGKYSEQVRENGHRILKITKAILKVKKRYDGITCLSILAAKNNTKLAEDFCKKVTDLKKWQEDVHHKDHSIHIAAANGHLEFVKLLLEKGVDVNCSGPGDWTPIMYAAQSGHIAIVNELLKRNADIVRVTKNKTCVCQMIVQYGCSVSILEALTAELKTSTNKHHLNCMLVAAVSRSDNERINIIKYLQTEGAKSTKYNCTGRIALHEAIKMGDAHVIDCLLTADGAKEWVNEMDEDSNTALLLASKKRNIKAMTLLVEHGALMSHQNEKGMSAWDGIMDMPTSLITNLIDPYKTTQEQNDTNPFFIALRQEKYKMMQQLFEHGVYAYSTDKNKNTIFHIAAREGKCQPLRYLEKYLPKDNLTDVLTNIVQPVFNIATKRTSSDNTTMIVAVILKILVKVGQDKYISDKLDDFAKSGDTLYVRNIYEAFEHLKTENVKINLQLGMKDTNGNTALHIAAKAGHIDIMRYLVRMNVDFAKKNKAGCTPLLEAIRNGAKPDIAPILEEYKLKTEEFGIDDTDNDGNTALHWCTQQGDWGNVEKLIQAGANMAKRNIHENSPLHSLVIESKKDPGKWRDYDQVLTLYGKLAAESKWWHKYSENKYDDQVSSLSGKLAAESKWWQDYSANNYDDQCSLDGFTELHSAALRGNYQVAEVLLDEKHEISPTALGDLTPLHCAARQGYAHIVELLILKGRADVRLRTASGLTALHLAVQGDHFDVAKSLIENRNASVDDRCNDGYTALHYAARKGYARVVELLLLKGRADARSRTAKGLTALHLAAQGVHFDAAKSLILSGKASLEDRLNYSEDDLTLLHVAAQTDNKQLADFLLGMKCEMSPIALNGMTPLHVACELNHVNVIDALLSHGAPVDISSWNGMTPLHVACKLNHVDVIDALLSHGAHVDIHSSFGLTPLHVAAFAGHLPVVEQLVKKTGVNLDRVADLNNSQLTPLHLAAAAGHCNVIRCLVDAGAELHEVARADIPKSLHSRVMDSDGSNAADITPLKAATAVRNTDAVALLLQYRDAQKHNTHAQLDKDHATRHIQDMTHDERTRILHFVSPSVLLDHFKYSKDNDEEQSNSKMNQKDGKYMPKERIAMMHLLWHVKDKGGESVISSAVSKGAVDVIDKVLDMQDIFRITDEDTDTYHYDITFLTPETMPEKPGKHEKGSCLELVMKLAEKDDDDEDNEILAAKILDTNPFKILIDSYHIYIQYVNYFFAIIHIIHMVLFTIYALPDGRIRNEISYCNGTVSNTTWDTLNSSSDPMVSSGPRHEWFLFFLIWPTLILVGFLILRLIDDPCFHSPSPPASNDNQLETQICCKRVRVIWNQLKKIYKVLRTVFLEVFPELCFLALCLSTYCWYFLSYCGHSAETYLQVCATVFILGWLTTLYFFVSPQQLIYMSVANHIAFRDIKRFTFIYSFILLGFGFAFHTLFQVSSFVEEGIESPWNTLFATFDLMVGLSSVLGDEFETNYKRGGGSPAFVYFVYLVYVVVASIVMLNLLIAMLTHSFDNCHNHASILWRVRALKLALNVIRIRQKLPIFFGRRPWSTHACKIREQPTKTWKLTIKRSKNKDDSSDKSEKIDNILKVAWRLEKQLDALRV